MLRNATLMEHGRRVRVPTYDRRLTPAVVHLGVGSFHRSHQAAYFDAVARLGATEWGIVGVGLRRPGMRDALAPQDGLYTLVQRSAEGDRATVVGVLCRYLFAPDDPAAVIASLADARTRLITLTLTPAGYPIDPAGGAFDDGHPDAVAHSRSALAYLVEAFDRRRRRGLPGVTVLSCDNMTANGQVTRTAVLGLAQLRDTRLAGWVGRNVSFPNAMVDRITPATTDADRAFVARTFGVADRWPVMSEDFSQWIVEDEFCNLRPPLDEVGVRYVTDVRPYALVKTRLLNASHCALGYLASAAGHRDTATALADPVFRRYLDALMAEEVAPLLPAVPGVDLDAYRAVILERLANPKLGDQLARLCRNGSAKLPVHVLPSIVASRRRGRPHPLLTLCVAGWCRHLRGADVPVDDARAHHLRALALAGRGDPRPLLAQRTIFGDVGSEASFAEEVESALRALDDLGARRAVPAWLRSAEPIAA